jgi:hypothetical protein
MKYRIIKQVMKNGDIFYIPQRKESFGLKWKPFYSMKVVSWPPSLGFKCVKKTEEEARMVIEEFILEQKELLILESTNLLEVAMGGLIFFMLLYLGYELSTLI